MATCEVCEREMTTADSCREWRARIAGRPWAVLRYGDEKAKPSPDRCGDCHVAIGGRHHPGCDMARCPRCKRQLISCGCWDGEVLVPQT